jgi:NAD(P)H-dependent FMN reductase
MDKKLKLTVVLASTRNGRRGEKVASWFLPMAEENGRFEVTLADLKEYDLPFYNDSEEPSDMDKKYPDPKVQAWSDTIDSSDAVIFVMPEYNYAVSAPLKNAIDHIYYEWLDKPVGFVGYGSRGAFDAIDSLRRTARALGWKVAPSIVGIRKIKKVLKEDGTISSDEEYKKTARQMLAQLSAICDSINK